MIDCLGEMPSTRPVTVSEVDRFQENWSSLTVSPCVVKCTQKVRRRHFGPTDLLAQFLWIPWNDIEFIPEWAWRWSHRWHNRLLMSCLIASFSFCEKFCFEDAIYRSVRLPEILAFVSKVFSDDLAIESVAQPTCKVVAYFAYGFINVQIFVMCIWINRREAN